MNAVFAMFVGQDSFFSTSRWLCHKEEAPLEWLTAMNLRTMALTIRACSVGMFFLAILIWLKGSWHFGTLTFVAGLVSGFASVILLQSSISPRLAEIISASAFTVSCAIMTWAPYFSDDDEVHRHRAMGMNFIVWKSILPVLGHRTRTSAIILFLSGVNEIIVTWVIFQKIEVHFPLRIICVIFFISALYLLTVQLNHLRWSTLYDAETQLTAEKEALESLLSMVCDSIFWLSTDCDCVLRSNAKFDSIMGRGMQGKSFQSFLSDSDGNCLGGLQKRLVGGIDKVGSPVTLLPTTICVWDAQAIKVDLFIVDRRGAFVSNGSQKTTSPSPDLGFLVGLRLCDPIAIAPMQLMPACDKVKQAQSKANSGSNAEPDNHDNASVETKVEEPEQAEQDIVAAERGTRNVRFSSLEEDTLDSASVTESISTEPRSILRRSSMDYLDNLVQGPPLGAPFDQSGTYLEECSMALLEDLLSCWNFEANGCCTWHSYLKTLRSLVYQMYSLHSCAEQWRPKVAWQCANCTAVLNDDHPTDQCWLCYEPQAVDSPGDLESESPANIRYRAATRGAFVDKQNE